MASPQLAVSSPTPLSPTSSLLEWDEGAVHGFLSQIGLSAYEDTIYEQGITGDVLAVMDHASLIDLGMQSIGHRLKVLRSVWELKHEQGIELGEDDWRPEDAQALPPRLAVESLDKLKNQHLSEIKLLYDYIDEQQDRLIHLERDHQRILTTLEDYGMTMQLSSSADGDDIRGIPGVDTHRQNGHTGRWQQFRNGSGHASDGDAGEPGPMTKANRRASALFPSSLASSSNSTAPGPPRSADSATFKDSFTPTTANATITFDSPSEKPRLGRPAAINPPSFNRLNSSGSITSPPPGAVPAAAGTPGSAAKGSSLVPASASSGPSPTPPTSLSTSSSSTTNPEAKSRVQDAKTAAHSAAKSFRVTLEDPCWKVLPAALKKYKINGDWRMYALFICFGPTERCLAYDEKPLMLFQKLKESGQKPVFMLRHMPQRDVRSPIAVAQQKQLARLGLPPDHPTSVLPRVRPVGESSSSPTKPNNLAPSARHPGRPGDDGTTPNGAAFPELPSPGLRDGESMAGNLPRSATGSGRLSDKEGKSHSVTYAVAIYPYISDRQDEFDVAVGAAFVITSKTKGWYIVQKDSEGRGDIVYDQTRQGWVPAGCLLELSAPICAVTPAQDINTSYPGLSPLTPSAIVSSSYPGVVLMDYDCKGDAEMSLREGEKVKVYKKYCHWSYTIKQDTGERGWVPAWFIGKLSGTDSAPTSAATPATSFPSAGSANSSYTQDEEGEERKE